MSPSATGTILELIDTYRQHQEMPVISSFENPFNVRYKGALKQMMRKGDIAAKADLKEIAELPNVYALGALENLKGEIQIFNEQPFNTFVQNDKAVIDSSFDKKATLLVWAQVENWTEISIPKDVHTFKQFESFIKKAAINNGIDPNNPFPFLLDGTASSLDWHIINWKDGDTEHSHEKHVQSGLHGTLKEIPVNILGFYSRHHHAIFTHHTTNIHAHFKTKNAPFGGHVDELKLGENMILRLPNPS